MQKHTQNLTPDQQLAVNLLAIGMNIKETARVIEKSPSVVSAWVNHDEAFKSALAVLQKDLSVNRARKRDN
jgi:hypothetical protein